MTHVFWLRNLARLKIYIVKKKHGILKKNSPEFVAQQKLVNGNLSRRRAASEEGAREEVCLSRGRACSYDCRVGASSAEDSKEACASPNSAMLTS